MCLVFLSWLRFFSTWFVLKIFVEEKNGESLVGEVEFFSKKLISKNFNFHVVLQIRKVVRPVHHNLLMVIFSYSDTSLYFLRSVSLKPPHQFNKNKAKKSIWDPGRFAVFPHFTWIFSSIFWWIEAITRIFYN